MLRFAKYFSFALVLVTGAYLFLVQPRMERAGVDIGGDFTLTDQNGATVTNESLKGKPRLVYFGFTYCPDICPTALLVMQHVAKTMGDAAPAQVFITVDPARDTVAQMQEFAASFPGLIALTGSVEAVKKAALAYRVYYEKAVETKGDPQKDYMINHSSFIYLMDAEGKYLAHFPHTIGADAFAKGVKQALNPL